MNEEVIEALVAQAQEDAVVGLRGLQENPSRVLGEVSEAWQHHFTLAAESAFPGRAPTRAARAADAFSLGTVESFEMLGSVPVHSCGSAVSAFASTASVPGSGLAPQFPAGRGPILQLPWLARWTLQMSSWLCWQRFVQDRRTLVVEWLSSRLHRVLQSSLEQDVASLCRVVTQARVPHSLLCPSQPVGPARLCRAQDFGYSQEASGQQGLLH